MTVHDFAQILRTRWLIIVGTTALVVLAALAYSLLATPRYQSSTRLFVSTTSDGTNTQTNDGGLFAQRRALSYTQLLTGGVVAQRTIDKLGLDMTVPALQREITASTPTDTVLIDLTVLDPSPVRARDIANTLSDEFVVMAAGLETPDLGARPNARVIVQQRASIPDAPVSPKTLQNLAIGFALGALLGLFAAIVRYRFDDRVTTAEHIEKATGVGLVADIPSDVSRRKEPLLAFGGDRSVIADAFRELRVNLQSLQVGSGSRVLLVTSSMPEEGRTTTAVNLALALAEADHTVVIVDGDLRRPRVASCLGVDGQRGVSTVLAGEARLDETLQDTRFPGLSAIASGVTPTNPTQLLGSSTAKELFEELSSRFDYVVVDSPSLLVTDAVILAGHASGVLVVAEYGETRRKQLAPAIDALRRAGAPLLGAILTMTPPKKRHATRDDYYKVAQSPQDSPLQGARERHSSHKK
ncbi:MAG: polysaccharide biosynthesis tyrosine autokinase [Actinomycetota bacterium]|nr:polysaccharide biosynthesis tyrosine autokinase [Actinomycetota bacterium]